MRRRAPCLKFASPSRWRFYWLGVREWQDLYGDHQSVAVFFRRLTLKTAKRDLGMRRKSWNHLVVDVNRDPAGVGSPSLGLPYQSLEQARFLDFIDVRFVSTLLQR